MLCTVQRMISDGRAFGFEWMLVADREQAIYNKHQTHVYNILQNSAKESLYSFSLIICPGEYLDIVLSPEALHRRGA